MAISVLSGGYATSTTAANDRQIGVCYSRLLATASRFVFLDSDHIIGAVLKQLRPFLMAVRPLIAMGLTFTIRGFLLVCRSVVTITLNGSTCVTLSYSTVLAVGHVSVCLSACLSMWLNVYVYVTDVSLGHTLYVFQRNSYISKNNGASLWNFSRTLDSK